MNKLLPFFLVLIVTSCSNSPENSKTSQDDKGAPVVENAAPPAEKLPHFSALELPYSYTGTFAPVVTAMPQAEALKTFSRDWIAPIGYFENGLKNFYLYLSQDTVYWMEGQEEPDFLRRMHLVSGGNEGLGEPLELALFKLGFQNEIWISQDSIRVTLLEDDLNENWIPAGKLEMPFENGGYLENAQN